MRKLIVSMNLTLDGFLSGPHCELDWHFESWSGDMAEALGRELSAADTLLLGHTTYTAMAHHWASMAQRTNCSREDIAFIEMINSITKVVVATTTVDAIWDQTRVMRAPLDRGIQVLKSTAGENIMVYGSSKLVAGLQALGVVDEYQLWLHPTAIGIGKTLFGAKQKMHLKMHEVFESGVVRLVYAPLSAS